MSCWGRIDNSPLSVNFTRKFLPRRTFHGINLPWGEILPVQNFSGVELYRDTGFFERELYIAAQGAANSSNSNMRSDRSSCPTRTIAVCGPISFGRIADIGGRQCYPRGPTRVSRAEPIPSRPVSTFYDPSSRQLRQLLPVTTALPRPALPPYPICHCCQSQNVSFLDEFLLESLLLLLLDFGFWRFQAFVRSLRAGVQSTLDPRAETI